MTNIKKQELYYFYTVGCGFCKKAEPLVDELIKEGYNILKLDLAESDNRGLKQELQKKYNKQCGTPWFINPETGHNICGYREKDILMKWIGGENIPEPPRPKSPPPKPPFHGASGKEEAKWKKEYKKWVEENSHLPNLQTADQILERPRPKSDPPQRPDYRATDEVIDRWGDDYEKWADDNSHLTGFNFQPKEEVIKNFKKMRDQVVSQTTQVKSPNETEKDLTEFRLQLTHMTKQFHTLEQKLDKLMKHLGV